MLLAEIRPKNLREWITHSLDSGLSPSTIRNIKAILSAVLSSAVVDGLIPVNPCRLVRAPFAPPRPLKIISPEQFAAILAHLPTAASGLLAELAAGTGLRWSELTELRASDFDATTRALAITRSVVQLGSRFHPENLRFWVKPYTKARRHHVVALSVLLAVQLQQHIADHHLQPDDLIFHAHMFTTANPAIPAQATQPGGLTPPNRQGRQYHHGTLSAYSAGRCRCQHCRDAIATYRRRRRAKGSDRPPKPRQRQLGDGHLCSRWYRRTIWYPAVTAAGIGHKVRLHDLRHVHASWLLAGGATLQQLKDRLDQTSLQSLQRYLHNLPDASNPLADAYERFRYRATTPPPRKTPSNAANGRYR